MTEKIRENLFERYGVKSPAPITGPRQYGSLLIREGIIDPMEADGYTDSYILWLYLQTFTPHLRSNLEQWRPHQRKMLNKEHHIDLKDPDLKTEIERIYTEEIDHEKLLNETPPSLREMAVIALKLALDYAEGNWPKIQFSEDWADFMPIFPGSSSEEVLGRTINIVQEANASEENIDDLIEMLDKLSIHIWRSPAIQMLRQAEMNIKIIDAGIRTVATGTDIPLTKEGELQTVAAEIAKVRRRIGEAAEDLEERLANLY